MAAPRSARMCDSPNASRNAMIAITSGRLASQGGSGVMNGVTALSIRKMARAASAIPPRFRPTSPRSEQGPGRRSALRSLRGRPPAAGNPAVPRDGKRLTRSSRRAPGQKYRRDCSFLHPAQQETFQHLGERAVVDAIDHPDGAEPEREPDNAAGNIGLLRDPIGGE